MPQPTRPMRSPPLCNRRSALIVRHVVSAVHVVVTATIVVIVQIVERVVVSVPRAKATVRP